MALNNDTFKKSIQSCKEVLSAGSVLYVGALQGCGVTDKVYYPQIVDNGTASTPVAINATSARLTLIAPNVSGDTVVLEVGTPLTFIQTGEEYTVYVTAQATLVFGSNVTVNFTPTPSGIAIPKTTTPISIDTGISTVEPKPYYLETDGTGVANATSMNLNLIAANHVVGDQIVLNKGSRFRLDNTTTYYVVAQDTIVGLTPVAVPIEASPLSGWADDTPIPYPVYELFQVLSTSELPVSFADTTEDITDHADGLQYSMTKTNFDITTAVTFRLRCEDPAMVNIIMPGADSNVRVFAVLSQGNIDGCGLLLYGEAQLVNINTTAAVKSFVKGTMTIQWQAPTVVITKVSALSLDELLEYNANMDSFMLPHRTA